MKEKGMKPAEKKELIILQKRKSQGSKLDQFEEQRLKILKDRFGGEKVNRSEIVSIMDSMLKQLEVNLLENHIHVDVLKQILIEKGVVSKAELEAVLQAVYTRMAADPNGEIKIKNPSLIIKP